MVRPLLIAFFRWQAIGRRMAMLDRQGKLRPEHKILRIYRKSRNKLVMLAREHPGDLPWMSAQELLGTQGD